MKSVHRTLRLVRSVALLAPAVAVAVAVVIVVLGSSSERAQTKTKTKAALLVAGASDLRPAFEKIGKLFTEQTGTNVTFSFGSSGQLAQQIRNGAPFDVFASADVSYVDKVVATGFGDPATKTTYAYGRLALWTPKTSSTQLRSVTELARDSVKRIAVANPEHAPYGVAAVQSLKSAGVYSRVSGRLVYGENVSDTYRIATSGNADAALVSLSLVIANSHGGRYTVVPSKAHEPLEQAMVVLGKGAKGTAAQSFVSLVASPKGRDIMRAYGFLLPGDKGPRSEG